MLPPLKSIGYKERGLSLKKQKTKLNQINDGRELARAMAATVITHQLLPP
jgi:hypothetical protein